MQGYETHVCEGRVLLAVDAMTAVQTRAAREIFDRYSGADVRVRPATTSGTYLFGRTSGLIP